MNYYISDLHFGHQSILTIDGRPFESLQAMQEKMLSMWNETVKNEDHVYIVGDVFGKEVAAPDHILKALNGHKHLIIGNHDRELVKRSEVINCFDSMHDLLEIRDSGRKIVLCHYPMTSWKRMRYGTLHIYGHIHKGNNAPGECYMAALDKALNAGCMINGYRPVTLEELICNNRQWKEWFLQRFQRKNEKTA